MTSTRTVPGPSSRSRPRWPVDATLAGRPSFVIVPLACSGAAVIAALRLTRHPAGPFAASLVEGVLPLGTAIAVARLVGTDPAVELQLSYPAAYRRTLLRRAALVAGWSAAFAAVTAAAVQETGLWAPGLVRAELAWFTVTAVLAAIALAAGAAAADGRIGAAVAALVWVIQEGLARSFAGRPALRPFYLFTTSRPGPDPAGYWVNRGSLLLIGAVAALAGWLLLARGDTRPAAGHVRGGRAVRPRPARRSGRAVLPAAGRALGGAGRRQHRPARSAGAGRRRRAATRRGPPGPGRLTAWGAGWTCR